MARITIPHFRNCFQYLFPKKYTAQQDFMLEIDVELAFWDYVGGDMNSGIETGFSGRAQREAIVSFAPFC